MNLREKIFLIVLGVALVSFGLRELGHRSRLKAVQEEKDKLIDQLTAEKLQEIEDLKAEAAEIHKLDSLEIVRLQGQTWRLNQRLQNYETRPIMDTNVDNALRILSGAEYRPSDGTNND